ncbi:hypothetical protein AAOGI_41380 [Agarivorans albus]
MLVSTVKAFVGIIFASVSQCTSAAGPVEAFGTVQLPAKEAKVLVSTAKLVLTNFAWGFQ